MDSKATTIDQYITNFPKEVQKLLQQIRNQIQKTAPEATEAISYGMPTFKLNDNLVHFAAYKNHIGFYPAPDGISNFKNELAIYKTSKGAIQFPMDQALPLGLITEIVKFRVVQNLAKAKPQNTHFAANLSAPAQRALANQKITSLKELANYTEKEILALHGVGLSAIPKLKAALAQENLEFKA